MPASLTIGTELRPIGQRHHAIGCLKKGQDSSSDALRVSSDGQNAASDALDPPSDAEESPSDAEELPSDGVLEGNERLNVPKMEKVSKNWTVRRHRRRAPAPSPRDEGAGRGLGRGASRKTLNSEWMATDSAYNGPAFQEHLLSPALSSTEGGGEGVRRGP